MEKFPPTTINPLSHETISALSERCSPSGGVTSSLDADIKVFSIRINFNSPNNLWGVDGAAEELREGGSIQTERESCWYLLSGKQLQHEESSVLKSPRPSIP